MSRRYLNQYRIKLERIGDDEPVTELEYPYDVGRRTKFGGCPDGIHGDVSHPDCDECGDEMYFLAQIDSFEHSGPCKEGDPELTELPKHIDFMFGDAGMLYIFHCFDCGETKAKSGCY